MSNDPNNYATDSMLTIRKPGTVVFEAENADLSNYVRSIKYNSNIIESPESSNGKYLAGASNSPYSISHGYFSFTLHLQFNSEIEMSVSYSHPIGLEGEKIDIRSIYNFLIDENKSVCLSSNYFLEPLTEGRPKWSTIQYDTFTLPKGLHSFRVSVTKNAQTDGPNIDYITFKFSEISENEIDAQIVPENDFHTAVQFAYLQDDFQNISLYAKGVIELSRPNPIIFDTSPDNCIEYSESPDFKNSITIENLNTTQFSLFNLKLSQDIFWRIESKKTVIHHLTVTNQGPRNLFIEGVTNVRDIGGYSSSLIENGRIFQGHFLRGAKLDDITLNGKKELLRLGIKVEIDMRDDYMCKGPYVDGIEYNAIPIPSRTEPIRFEKFEDEYRKIFNLIAQANLRPIYLHCSVGADRTGIVTFILLVLCGVSYEDAARDYLFTNFSTCGARYLESEFIHWWKKLDLFDGKTKTEKAKSWLLSKGLDEETVEKIREVFVEGYKNSK